MKIIPLICLALALSAQAFSEDAARWASAIFDGPNLQKVEEMSPISFNYITTPSPMACQKSSFELDRALYHIQYRVSPEGAALFQIFLNGEGVPGTICSIPESVNSGLSIIINADQELNTFELRALNTCYVRDSSLTIFKVPD